MSVASTVGTPGGQFAHTVDITEAGARVGGLRAAIEAGQAITLQRGLAKARFRVIWTKQLGPNEIQAGIECTEPNKDFWGFDIESDETPGGSDQELLMKILLAGK